MIINGIQYHEYIYIYIIWFGLFAWIFRIDWIGMIWAWVDPPGRTRSSWWVQYGVHVEPATVLASRPACGDGGLGCSQGKSLEMFGDVWDQPRWLRWVRESAILPTMLPVLLTLDSKVPYAASASAASTCPWSEWGVWIVQRERRLGWEYMLHAAEEMLHLSTLSKESCREVSWCFTDPKGLQNGDA